MADAADQRSRHLAEIYTPRRDLSQLETLAGRIRRSVEAIAASGVAIRHVQVVFVPAEETCFHLFDAPSVESVEQVLRRAGVEAERISAAFDIRTSGGGNE